MLQVPTTNQFWIRICRPYSKPHYFSACCINAPVNSQWKCAVLVSHHLVMPIKRMNEIRTFSRKVTFFPLFLCSDTTASFQAFWIKIVHNIIHSITSDVKIVLLPYFLVHGTIPKKFSRTFQLLLYCIFDFFRGNLWIIVIDFETSQTSV